MPACSRYLQGTLHLLLALHVRKVKLKFALSGKELSPRIDDSRLHEFLSVQVSDDLIDVSYTIDIEVVHHSSLAHICFGNKEALVSQLAGLDGDRQCPFYGLQRAVQTQFAHHHVAVQQADIHLAVCRQYANGHRKVET